MTNKDLQDMIKGPLLGNLGNKLTTELVAGLMASIAENLLNNIEIIGKDKDNGL